jgi:hypothetical protein
MKTSNYFSSNVKQKFEKFFDRASLTRLGKTSGFIQRDSKKITAYSFVAGFIECCIGGSNTFSAWASAISSITGKSLTKQGLHERMTSQAVDYCKAAFQHTLTAKLKSLTDSRLFKTFKRVLLQDSTTLKLPPSLSQQFPGNCSRGVQKAVARLQCLLNLRTLQWVSMELKAFTDNDQGASGQVLPLLRKGDLLIRDLGYFVLDVFSNIIKQKAFFISRLRYGITFYDRAGHEVSWKAVVNKRGVTDKVIWIGKKEKIRVRLIMIPLPDALLAERVRKAKCDRDKRLNHSPDYYQWLGYSVFMSNVEKQTLSAEEIAKAYRVRWQIELLFKSWKSGYRMQELLHEGCTNEHRVRACIYMLLMLICLVVQKVYVHYYHAIKNKYNKCLSLLKLSEWIGRHLLLIIVLPAAEIKKLLVMNCCYEHRKDRINMTDFIHDF